MKRIKFLLLLLLTFSFFGCNKNQSVDLSGYSIEVRQSILDFTKTYKNKDDAYIVSDFDNTTVIFDIALIVGFSITLLITGFYIFKLVTRKGIVQETENVEN